MADSLLASLKIQKEDSGVIMTYIRLARFFENTDPEMSVGYANKALTISRRTGFDRGTGLALKITGNYHYDKSDFDMAMRYYRVAFTYLSGSGDMVAASGVLANIGNVYGVKGEYEKCLEFFLKSLKMDESIGNKKGIAGTTGNIGELYVMKSNLDEGLSYHYRSLALKKEMNISRGLARAYNNIGMVYSLKNVIDSAIPYLLQSLKIAEQYNDIQDMVNAYSNLSGAYMNAGNVDSALYFGLKSAGISVRAGNRYGEGLRYIECARMLTAKKRYDDAFEYANKGLTIGRNLDSRFIIATAYLQISAIYAAIKSYDSAYYFSRSYYLLKDSLMNDESSRQMAEMATRFETEKKQKEIELQKEKLKRQQSDITRQQLVSLGISIGLMLSLLLAFFIFRGYKLKKAANALLEKKNEEITQQKRVIEEKNTNITDSISYASRIQQAILVPEDLIRKTIKDFFIFSRPKDIVSGDFYFFDAVNEWIIFAAVDCTGHGVPGALMSMIGNSLLNEIVSDAAVNDLGALLNTLDMKLKKALNPSGHQTTVKDGMDISCMALNHKTNKIQLTGANNPALYIFSGQCNEAEPVRCGIGDDTSGKKKFTFHEFPLVPGGMVYLFTDGFEDQFGGPKGKKFKSGKMKELLVSVAGKPVSEQKAILQQTFDEWIGTGEQTDDVTVIGIRV